MKNVLKESEKGKIIKFDLYPLESLQEPIEKDKPIKCPNPQYDHVSSFKSTFYRKLEIENKEKLNLS